LPGDLFIVAILEAAALIETNPPAEPGAKRRV
jgi:hypothetical protein